jgi:hypothetical protein
LTVFHEQKSQATWPGFFIGASLLAGLSLYTVSSLAWNVSNRVEIVHGPLAIDHGKSIADITRTQDKGGFAGGYGLGLFQSRIKAELIFEQTDLPTRRLRLLTRIQTNPVIYIAKEFPEKSCAYGVILGHERLHQGFDLEVLRTMPDEIRAITRQVFSTDALDASRKIDLERMRKHFFQQYQYVYDGLSLPRHQTIDNPDSYRHLSGQCNGEIGRYLPGEKG